MDEKYPNPFREELSDFDKNKEVYEAEVEAQHADEWFDAVRGEAGKTDFSDEARQRLEDAARYHAYMERASQSNESGIDHVLSTTQDVSLTKSDALRRDAELRQLQDDALAAKFEAKGNANLRMMNNISHELFDLRDKEASEDPDEVNRDDQRIKHLEDRLNDQLVRYEASDNYDPVLANWFMDREDAEAREQAGKNALHEATERNESDAERAFSPEASLDPESESKEEPKGFSAEDSLDPEEKEEKFNPVEAAKKEGFAVDDLVTIHPWNRTDPEPGEFKILAFKESGDNNTPGPKVNVELLGVDDGSERVAHIHYIKKAGESGPAEDGEGIPSPTPESNTDTEVLPVPRREKARRWGRSLMEMIQRERISRRRVRRDRR